MADAQIPIPMSHEAVADAYFMEHRAKLLDIAAFLDRLDRADGPEDFRVTALREALSIVADGQGDRAKRMLLALSDHSMVPLASAAGMKGAYGAYPGSGGGE